MVVLVLIGVLSALIIPEMKGTYGDALLRSSARDLVNVCHIAYSRAVSLNQVQVIRFQSANGRYEIQRQSQNRSRPELVPLKDVSGSHGELDNRISLEVHKTAETEPQDGGMESGPGGGTENASSSSNPTADQDTEHAQDVVGFYPDGTADRAELWLRDRAGFGLRLRIDPITARVEILELTKEQATTGARE